MNTLIKSLICSALLVLSFNAAAAPVDINSADAATLAANIKGVGAKKAEAIVIYRQKHGPFSSIEDLRKIKGIGPKLIEKNRSVLLVKKSRK